jgi:hypothetical protein
MLNAHQPTDFKSASSVECFCMTGLPEKKKLALDELKGGILFTAWVSTTRSYIESCGVDMVFWVNDPIMKTEVYPLEDWGTTKETEIFTWVQTLKTGVPKEDGMLLPMCTFAGDNLAWSSTAILASISTELWEAIDKDLGFDAMGPKVFNTVVQNNNRLMPLWHGLSSRP